MTTREWLSSLFWSVAFWSGVLGGMIVGVTFILFLVSRGLGR